MRIREAQHILKREVRHLSVNASNIETTPAGNARRFARTRLEEALRNIAVIEVFHSDADKALKHGALQQPGEPTFVLDNVVADFTQNHITPLAVRASNLLALLDQSLPPEDPLSFSYQLPDPLPDQGRDIEAFADEVKALKLLLDEPVARTAGGRLQVLGVDRGSILVELGVASQDALIVVGAICTAALALLGLRQKYRKYEHEHASLNLDLKLKESVVAANVAALDKVSRDLAESVVSRAGKPGDNEAANVVQLSIKQLSEKLEAGAVLYLSGTAPPEAQKIFPKPGDPPLLHSAVIKELLAVNPANEVDADASEPGT